MSDNDDDITKPDMTRIEDLSEFLHPDDPEADAQLDLPSTPDQEEDESFETMSLDDLEEDEAPPAFSEADSEEDTFALSEEDDEEQSGEFSSDSTQPDFESPSFTDQEEDQESGFGAEASDSEEVLDSFSEEDESFEATSFEDSDDEDFSLEEMDELDEEAKLQEEVDNEIQEALEEDESENSFQMAEDELEEEDSPEPENEFEPEVSQFDSPLEDSEDAFEPIVEDEPTPMVQSVNTPMEDSFSQEHQKELAPKNTDRETFKDLNEFGNAISYGQVAAGGNPPFSIVLRKIKYLEDSERIIEILREHGLCDESNEADFQQGLNNGSMLISQLNEYSAIYLAHKFRRFDLEILVGLSDEVHPSKNYDMDYKGLVRKENLTQNKQETFSLEEQVIQVEAILLATTPTLENYRIDRYLGLVSAHIMIEEEEFQRLQETDLKNKNEDEVDPDELLRELDQDDLESKTSTIEIGLEEIYQNLAESLKAKAFKMKGNAVVGINYQITPLINQKPTDQNPSINYKISCTGNTVWVGGKEAPRSEA
ncbi:MAG: hypothetical protein ACJAT2_002810 [Bacteriovoracaceae bacterium]|jgi:uncharacterized protein YbjQ (UPF0145 family)